MSVPGPDGTRVFVQARMSSSRFPGKVLAPVAGRPLIDHVVVRLARALGPEAVTVATSVEPSDDPLAAYLERRGVDVLRGPLDQVFSRFCLCLERRPCRWFFRVCADSPLVNVELIKPMLAAAGVSPAPDLVTNTLVRTFPKGRSLELVRAETFAGLDPAGLTPDQQEHVTKVFYDRREEFKIENIVSGDEGLALTSLAVDTVDDLRRIEAEQGEALRKGFQP